MSLQHWFLHVQILKWWDILSQHFSESQFLLSFSSWLLILVRSGCCLLSCAINGTPQHSRPNAKNKPLVLFETTESEFTSSVSNIHAQNVYFKQQCWNSTLIYSRSRIWSHTLLRAESPRFWIDWHSRWPISAQQASTPTVFSEMDQWERPWSAECVIGAEWGCGLRLRITLISHPPSRSRNGGCVCAALSFSCSACKSVETR